MPKSKSAPPRTAYSYQRFSTPEQSKGDSIRRQTDRRTKYLARHPDLFLDTSLKLTDLGVSAFRGDNAATGALKAFLIAIEQGKVAHGSVLLIESLDRLSRSSITVAAQLFLDLIRAGISVITLMPEREYSTQYLDDNPNLLTEVITILWRANEESTTKSYRMKEAWSEKRKNIGTEKLSKICPAWLKLSDDRKSFIRDEQAVKTIKLIFKLTIEGVGLMRIIGHLNKHKITNFGRSKNWQQTYLLKILRSRAVLGEYQLTAPDPKNHKKRIPIGETIKGYFPRIISEADYYKAQNAINARDRRKGSNGKGGAANLFKGIIFDADAYFNEGIKAPMVICNRDSGRHYISSMAINRLKPTTSKGTPNLDKQGRYKFVAVPVGSLSISFCIFLTEVDAKDIAPAKPRSHASKELAELHDELTILDGKEANIKARIASQTAIDSYLDMLATFDAHRKKLVAAIQLLKASDYSSNGHELVAESKHVLDLLRETPESDRPALRLRLRSQIAKLVEAMYVQIRSDGWTRLTTLFIRYASGKQSAVVFRSYRGTVVECYWQMKGRLNLTSENPSDNLADAIRLAKPMEADERMIKDWFTRRLI